MVSNHGLSYDYLAHVTRNSESAAGIVANGLLYQEGRPNVGADLIHNLTFADLDWEREHWPKNGEIRFHQDMRLKEPGETHILILGRPKGKIVHYGNTSATIRVDKDKKRIVGYPMAWKSGRAHLAIFDTKQKIGALIPHSPYKFEKQVKLVHESEESKYKSLSSSDTLVDYIPSVKYKNIIYKVRKKIKNLDKIDVVKYSGLIANELHKYNGYKKEGIDINDIAHKLLLSTIESQVVKLVREHYIKTKKYIGYIINDRGKEVDPFLDKVKNGHNNKVYGNLIRDFLEKIKTDYITINNPNFTFSGNEILKRYLRIHVNKIYNELKSAGAFNL